MAGQWKKGAILQLWDGKVSNRIVEHMARILAGNAEAPALLPE
jgi:hypothetical protein